MLARGREPWAVYQYGNNAQCVYQARTPIVADNNGIRKCQYPSKCICVISCRIIFDLCSSQYMWIRSGLEGGLVCMSALI